MVDVTGGKSAAGGHPPPGLVFVRFTESTTEIVTLLQICPINGVTSKYVQPKELRFAIKKAPVWWGLFS